MSPRSVLVTVAVGCCISAAAGFTVSGTGIALKRNGKAVFTSAPSLRAGKSANSCNMAAVTTKESARSHGLALALDDGTRKSHSMAENTQFVTGFFKGISNRDTFGKLVCSLYFVYEAMESAFDETTDENVKSMDFKSLRRLAALEADMQFFFGEDWKQTVKASPETAAYVAQIRKVSQTTPLLLIAHQYTRYLGDLFGGQMMSGMAVRSLGLEGKDGVSFYHFQDIPNPKDFIEEWYSSLNALPLSQAQKQEIVDEANLVFNHNIRILQELDSRSWGAYLAMARLAYVGIAEKLWGRDAGAA